MRGRTAAFRAGQPRNKTPLSRGFAAPGAPPARPRLRACLGEAEEYRWHYSPIPLLGCALARN
eukprot:8029396-Pyramimonas_sp.AAC.1